MKTKKFNVIGTMSGTSCDGLDIAYCSFWRENKVWKYSLNKSEFEPYTSTLNKKLLGCSHLNSYDLKKLDIELGEFAADKLLNFIKKNAIKPTLISTHGHTVLHNPSEKITLQIGNPLVINYKTKIDVISNFRELDVLMGGQGAPLVPYGDKELFGEYDYCINIGGIANVSKLYSNELTAYDICPANIVLNKYAKKKGLPFDKNGELASNGNKINSLLEKLNQLNYYQLKGPKSLDINYIEKKFFPLLTGYSSEDVLNTFTNHIAYQINKSINKEKSKVLLTGGGTYNNYLIKKINSINKLNNDFVVPNNDIISFKEAIIFGYLGLLRYLELKNINKSVTGSSSSSSSGSIFKLNLC